MIVNHLSPESDSYLEYLHQDPVHGISEERPVKRRIKEDREIFFRTENRLPVAVLCVAYTRGLPDKVSDILDISSDIVPIEQATHAIFYSVFRTDVESFTKNIGADLVLEAAEIIKEKYPDIRHFTTMSPIPTLRENFNDCPDVVGLREFLENKQDPVARFHISNGARLLRVILDADDSEKRVSQSWGHMANYDYTEVALK